MSLQVLPDDDPIVQVFRFDEKLRPTLAPAHNGKYVVIDPERQAYAVSRDAMEAHDELRKQGSTGPLGHFLAGTEYTYEMFHSR